MQCAAAEYKLKQTLRKVKKKEREQVKGDSIKMKE